MKVRKIWQCYSSVFTDVVLWVYEGFQRNEGIRKVPLYAMSSFQALIEKHSHEKYCELPYLYCNVLFMFSVQAF